MLAAPISLPQHGRRRRGPPWSSSRRRFGSVRTFFFFPSSLLCESLADRRSQWPFRIAVAAFARLPRQAAFWRNSIPHVGLVVIPWRCTTRLTLSMHRPGRNLRGGAGELSCCRSHGYKERAPNLYNRIGRWEMKEKR